LLQQTKGPLGNELGKEKRRGREDWRFEKSGEVMEERS
jgi:hypothetical protein